MSYWQAGCSVTGYLARYSVVHNACLLYTSSYGSGATIFPQALAMGATWNRKLTEEVAMVIGDETVAVSYTHLDVYKRQPGAILWLTLFRDKIDEIMEQVKCPVAVFVNRQYRDCLLYTSPGSFDFNRCSINFNGSF